MDRIMLSTHRIDLRTTDGEGNFPCPKCGALISPDDETDDTYSIVETKMKSDILGEIVILCKCGATLGLFLQ